MKVTMLKVVIDAFGTILKKLIKGPEDLETKVQVEAIQSKALRSARMQRRVLAA